MIRKSMLTLIGGLGTACAMAQGNEVVASAGQEGLMRSNGKIGVVLAVCVTILVGLILYLVRLDMRISRLEKKKTP